MSSLTTINSYFLTRVNQFENNIFARFWTTDPYAGLIESKPFELEMGLTPVVVTATHELPTSYLPLTTVSLALSNGTGNAACTPASVTNIGGGYITRSFGLTVNAFQTEAFCLTDLQFKFQWEQQARFREKGLGDYVTQFQGDWARVNNISQINNKISTTAANTFTLAQNGANTFATFNPASLPTVTPSWNVLGQLYDRLNQIGAQQNAVAMSDGTPVYALNVGPGLKRLLFQGGSTTATPVRTSVDYLDMGKEYSRNFLARGIDTAINGFLPNVDLCIIRYDASLNPIYPFTNSSAGTTVGTQAIPNPNYRTVANGGLAVYEQFSVMARGIYSKRPRPVGPLQAGLQAFNPITYSGEVRWINNPDMSTNVLGNYGFYRIDIQQAAMPEFPELGYTGITLATD
jgi:hypothetical protein